MNDDAQLADETNRLRRAYAAFSVDAVPRDDCPPAERLWDAAQGSAAEDVRELLEHAAECGVCAESWRLARELEPEAAAARVPRTPGWQRPAWAAAAAAAMLVMVVGLGWLGPSDGPSDTVRGSATPEVVRVPADGGGLSRSDPVLSWPAEAGATYDLFVMTEDLDSVVRAEGLSSAEYRISDADLAGFADGTVLLWRVEVDGADGTDKLEPLRFVLEP